MKVGPCVRCKLSSLRYSFVDGEGFVCDTCEPTFEVNFHVRPGMDATTFAVISANVRGDMKCMACGYSWRARGVSCVTFDEIKRNGINKPFISSLLDCGHPLIEAHKNIARERAMTFFKKDMLTCSKCEALA